MGDWNKVIMWMDAPGLLDTRFSHVDALYIKTMPEACRMLRDVFKEGNTIDVDGGAFGWVAGNLALTLIEGISVGIGQDPIALTKEEFESAATEMALRDYNDSMTREQV